MSRSIAFAGPASLFAGLLLWGGLSRVNPAPGEGEAFWSGAAFASLGWMGLLSLFVCLSLAWSVAADRAEALAYVGLSGQLLLVSAAATIALAVASECQNYWDAYHFSALAWTFGLASIGSLLAVLRAVRLGSGLGLSLRAPAVASVGLFLLGWAWTWSFSLQSLVSELARALFLATHG
jgi:hypothetical protein